jgi:hypothetical protein
VGVTLPSTQTESPLALIPLPPTCHVSFKSMYSTVNKILHILYFDPDYPTSDLTVTGLTRVCCTPLDARKHVHEDDVT